MRVFHAVSIEQRIAGPLAPVWSACNNRRGWPRVTDRMILAYRPLKATTVHIIVRMRIQVPAPVSEQPPASFMAVHDEAPCAQIPPL